MPHASPASMTTTTHAAATIALALPCLAFPPLPPHALLCTTSLLLLHTHRICHTSLPLMSTPQQQSTAVDLCIMHSNHLDAHSFVLVAHTN